MTTAIIPAGITEDDRIGKLWERLSHADWSSSAAAYATASDARRIIEMTRMTEAAFAAECKARSISGFGSQASVSRRLRWADLHDHLWTQGILPRGVFLSESATRPLFDGKLTEAERLRLLAELFGPFLSDDDKRGLAADLTEALMREHLARQGHSGRNYRAPRRLVMETVIARLLAEGHAPGEIIECVRQTYDSARNATSGAAR